MKPAPFRYERPADVAAVLVVLEAAGGGAKIIAGGQSLGPMLNLRLAQPAILVDIAAIDALKMVEVDNEDLVIGACVTHADIEDGRLPDEAGGLLSRIAAGIAYRAVRNRGTIGGSICHADPAADWVTVLPALGASVMLASLKGSRTLAIGDFLTGALSNALSKGEMLVAIRIPIAALARPFGYAKHCRKVGEFSKASAAISVDTDAGAMRIVLGALDGPPIMLDDVSQLYTQETGGISIDQGAVDDLLVKAGMRDPVRRHIHGAILAKATLDLNA